MTRLQVYNLIFRHSVKLLNAEPFLRLFALTLDRVLVQMYRSLLDWQCPSESSLRALAGYSSQRKLTVVSAFEVSN